MRRNRGNPKRNMAKHELEPCLPKLVGWRRKAFRGKMDLPLPNPKLKPQKKSRVIMSEIVVDPNWVCFTPERAPLGKRGAARKPKPAGVKPTNAELFELGIKPDRRWLKRMELDFVPAH